MNIWNEQGAFYHDYTPLQQVGGGEGGLEHLKQVSCHCSHHLTMQNEKDIDMGQYIKDPRFTSRFKKCQGFFKQTATKKFNQSPITFILLLVTHKNVR